MNNKEFIIGKLGEDEFAKLFTNVTSSTKEQDMYEHWDLKLTTKIDVKTIKKENRYDTVYNENFHWVEIKNVNGKLSWLYGEADYFAFETNDYWIVVDKLKLQEFIKTKMVGKLVGKSKDPYELYQRDNRKDVIVKVKTIDLIYIATKLIKKYEEVNNES
jgi:hypothetical protein